MAKVAVDYQNLAQIARQANWLEMNGNIPGSDRLRMLLESYNCCLFCGTKQVSGQTGIDQSEIWICPVCND